MQNQYAVLGVAQGADPEVIKAAWRALCQKYHPDRFDGPPEVANEKMSSINRAYKILSDPELRAQHDRDLSDDAAPSAQKEPPARTRTEVVDYTTPHPWRRFFAANVDLWVLGLISAGIVYLFIYLFSRESLRLPGDSILILALFWVGLFVELDASITEHMGTTPGKWLFGLSVISRKGANLVRRSAWRMLWLLVPLLPAHGYHMLMKYGTTYWDKEGGTSVAYKKTSNARDLLAAAAVVVTFILFSILTTISSGARAGGAHGVGVNTAQKLAPFSGSLDNVDRLPELDPNEFRGAAQTPEQTPNSARQITSEESKKEHYRRIYAAHPDADAIFSHPAFGIWLQQNPDRLNAIKQGSTDQVIEAFSEFKRHQQNRQEPPAARPQKIARDNGDDLRPAKPRCVFRSVMTDDEYRACGVNPPGSE